MNPADTLLDHILDSLRQGGLVDAAWLAGSRGRGSHDEFSDIDIWIALDDAAILRAEDDPLGFVHSIVPTVMQIMAPSIAPNGGAFVGTWVPTGDEFVQVDWYIAPAGTVQREHDTILVIGDVPVSDPLNSSDTTPPDIRPKIEDNLKLALLMISNMVKHARRGQFWRVADHARHTDACLVRARSLLSSGVEPDFIASKQSVLQGVPPRNPAEVQELALQLLDETENLAVQAGIDLQGAIVAMRSVIHHWQGVRD